MNLNEAIDIARQGVNHYKAFKKLEEVLEYVAKLEQAIPELESKRDTLSGEVSDRVALKKDLEKDYVLAEQRLRENHLRLTNELNEVLRQEEEKVRAAKKDLRGAMEEIERERSEAESSHKAFMKTIALEQTAAEDKLAGTMEGIRSLKAQIADVG